MAKIKINKRVDISIDIDKLCEVLIDLPMKQKLYIINCILENYSGNESPLKALAEQKHKDCLKNVKIFEDLAKDPVTAYDAYNDVAERYKNESKIWKEFIDLENKK